MDDCIQSSELSDTFSRVHSQEVHDLNLSALWLVAEKNKLHLINRSHFSLLLVVDNPITTLSCMCCLVLMYCF